MADASWRPLLDGSLRDSASALAIDLARALRDGKRFTHPSLGHGSAGAALCLGHVGAAAGDDALIDGAADLLADAIGRASTLSSSPDLAGGFTGIAWAVEHLQRELAWSEDDPNTTADEALEQVVAREPWLYPWGHLDGLAGVGAYFLERLPAYPALPCLERVVLHLLESSYEGKTPLAAWWTAPGYVAPPLRERYPSGYHDLTVPQGVPGILGFLGQVHSAGVSRAEVTGLLARGLEWVCSKRSVDGPSLPHYLGPGAAAGPPGHGGGAHEAAWTGAVLLLAAESLGDARRIDEVREWLRESANEEVAAPLSGAGSAGRGHLYNRLFQRTGEAVFAELATEHLRAAVEHETRRRTSWEDGSVDPRLFTGLAGTALALMAACSSRSPTWDRLLLLSTHTEGTAEEAAP